MLLPLPSTCYNMFSIEMINPNYMTHLDHVVRIIITWSEWRDLNSPKQKSGRVALYFFVLICKAFKEMAC